MIPACDTLFHPFESGVLPSLPEGDILFLNALPHAVLQQLAQQKLTLVQPFKPYAAGLDGAGFSSFASLSPESGRAFDAVFILTPKNQRQAEYELAAAHETLKPGGLLIGAAANDAGGARLTGMLEKMGVEGVSSLSKHKCRVAWGKKGGAGGNDTLKTWLAQGQIRRLESTGFFTCPGLFSWDRLDKGSEILLRFLPQDLQGRGADFGCGYGALSQAVLRRDGVRELICADADARALECCQLNTGGDPRARFIWCDLIKAQESLKSLDFIVMNPPFHEGKFEAASIGQGFIRTAAASLRKGGRLLMVANTHLPYETMLQSLFTRVQKPHEGGGFKIIEAEL